MLFPNKDALPAVQYPLLHIEFEEEICPSAVVAIFTGSVNIVYNWCWGDTEKFHRTGSPPCHKACLGLVILLFLRFSLLAQSTLAFFCNYIFQSGTDSAVRGGCGKYRMPNVKESVILMFECGGTE